VLAGRRFRCGRRRFGRFTCANGFIATPGRQRGEKCGRLALLIGARCDKVQLLLHQVVQFCQFVDCGGRVVACALANGINPEVEVCQGVLHTVAQISQRLFAAMEFVQTVQQRRYPFDLLLRGVQVAFQRSAHLPVVEEEPDVQKNDRQPCDERCQSGDCAPAFASPVRRTVQSVAPESVARPQTAGASEMDPPLPLSVPIIARSSRANHALTGRRGDDQDELDAQNDQEVAVERGPFAGSTAHRRPQPAMRYQKCQGQDQHPETAHIPQSTTLCCVK
jgi:hypothetical protein